MNRFNAGGLVQAIVAANAEGLALSAAVQFTFVLAFVGAAFGCAIHHPDLMIVPIVLGAHAARGFVRAMRALEARLEVWWLFAEEGGAV